NHGKDHYKDHQYRGNFVKDPIETFGVGVAVSFEIPPAADQKPVDAAHHDHQHELDPQPQIEIGAGDPGQARSQNPRRDHGRIDDRLDQLALHHFEALRPFRSRL